MIHILSPAKLLDFDTEPTTQNFTLPEFIKESEQLMEVLKKKSPKQISKLMDLSIKLSELNFTRYQLWKPEFTPPRSKQAVLAFNGEVYHGLKAKEFTVEKLNWAQNHLRILSGLHGVLKPLDLIRPYRLEMGTKLKIGRKVDLYQFWGEKIRKNLEDTLKKTSSEFVINLASSEYSKAAQLSKLKGKVITIDFKQMKDNTLSSFTVYTKRARGLMSRFIIDHEIENPEDLKSFDSEGYLFEPNRSNESKWLFSKVI